MSTAIDLGRARAWAWVAHLRAGGTTPWAAWEPPAPGAATSRFLPGAQQLELLRHLNAAGTPSAALVERVLTASAPGRGRPDLELVGVDEDRRFGPPAVDPGALPDHELLRVATGLLAEDVLAAGAPPAEERRPRRLRTRYQLAGDPWLGPAWTRELTAAGRPPGGAGRAVHVLGGDVADMLAHTWAAQAFGAGAPAWPDFLARVRARRRLPRVIALPDVVARFQARPHTGLVQVVLDPVALPRLVGVRRLGPVPDPPAHATELAREVGAALSLHVLPDDQARLLTTVLRPRMARLPGARPGVPPEHRDWVEDAGFALRQRLLRARYPVVGDPDAVLPRAAADPGAGSVLDLAIELLLSEEDR
jgi:hypothetical protein